MPQYVAWFGMDPKTDKDRFYTDQRCRLAYQDWARQIVMRYRDNPAVLAWELANEPRCEKEGVDTLLEWVGEMSAFIRSLDSNHLIAVGDEGYFRHRFAFGNPLFNGSFGVSCEELLGIGDIDFGTVHLYPESMGKGQDPVEFGMMWIREHIEAAQRANKPMLIEEYGLKAPEQRNAVFDRWLKSIEELNGMGDMLWMLGLPKGAGQPYAPDQYVIENLNDAPVIRAHADRILRGPSTEAITA
jgi:mannan endo-1,4-beta-mannosidase